MLDDITERRKVVSEYVRAGQLTQREIALRVGVSERTIRSDIADLRKQELWGSGSTEDDSGPVAQTGAKDSKSI